MIEPTEHMRLRFMAKVDMEISPPCWMWTGQRKTKGLKDPNGYGYFRIGSEGYRAHRVAVVMDGRELKDSDIVMHTCDRPPCVNPAHLKVASHTENIADRTTKNRSAKGTEHGLTQLTEDEVLEICRRVDSGETALSISQDYNASRRTIGNIATGKTWSWLTGRIYHGV